MTNRIRGAHAVALAVFAIAAPAAAAAPVSVNLRVEGPSQTIFDGPVTTDGHAITTPSGGTHPCDGTNNGAHPAPVPVATAALDDGARLNGFAWDADWFDSLNDFAVKEVAGEAQTSSQFWGYAVNFEFASVGGCQMQVRQGDEVLWIFDAFNKSHVLKLAGPSAATTGAPVAVEVTDGQDGSPQECATSPVAFCRWSTTRARSRRGGGTSPTRASTSGPTCSRATHSRHFRSWRTSSTSSSSTRRRTTTSACSRSLAARSSRAR
jgi:hypothetical protein